MTALRIPLARGVPLPLLAGGAALAWLAAWFVNLDNPFAVPLVVLIAIPLYSNAAGTIPIVEALLGKGLPLGTTLAFMMAIVAINLPEFVILRRVIRPQLIAMFASVVVAGVLVVGLLFNALGL